MAEIVGAVSGILTICEAASTGLRCVSGLLNAPAEIVALQTQVDLVSSVLQAAQNGPLQQDDAMQRVLSTTSEIVQKLMTMIETKLLRQMPSPQARRRSWLLRKRQVLKLRDELREARETLLLALHVHSGSSIHTLERELQLFTNAALQVQPMLYAMSVQECHSRDITTSSTGGESDALVATSELQPCISFAPGSQVLVLLSGKTVHEGPRLPQAEPENPDLKGQARDSHRRDLVSASIDKLETLPFIEPEGLTQDNGVPGVFACYCRETETSMYTRTNAYSMLFAVSPRQWRRATILITLGMQSPFWHVWKVPSNNPRTKHAIAMPREVVRRLKQFLSINRMAIKQDCHLAMFIGSRTNTDDGSCVPMPRILPRPDQVQSQLQRFTEMVHHWGCARFSERELSDHRPQHKHRPKDVFITWLKNRWVCQFRFSSDPQNNESTFYSLRVLHCLRSRASINPLIGIILDSDCGIINSYVCEMPAKGILYHVMTRAMELGNPVKWSRRLKWCKQITAGLAHVHSEGFVFGAFGSMINCGVGIDAYDDAVLYWGFQEVTFTGCINRGRLPPESRFAAIDTNGCVQVTHSLDIFQLGLVLWGIIMNRSSLQVKDFCEMLRCPLASSGQCGAPHTDPIELPMTDDVFPTLRDIIALCRGPVAARPPAWRLLQMYDDLDTSGDETVPSPTPDEGPRGPLVRLEDCLETYDRLTACDICGERISGRAFHCDVCSAGDFDMCERCFVKGCHCLDSSHHLLEYLPGEHTTYAYHSMPGEAGQRKVLRV